jgi:translation initiation factor 1A
MNNIKNNKKTDRKKNKTQNLKRDLQLREDGQIYAKVLKTLGNCRLELECYDGVKRIGHIRGSMKNKIWIATGDIVLACTRDFQNDKCDIILKYTPEEIRKIIGYGELPSGVNEDIKEEENEDNAGFTFEDI